MDPIKSVTEWMDGVGHGPEESGLYVGLVMEETAEMMGALDGRIHGVSMMLDGAGEDLEHLANEAKHGLVRIPRHNRAEVLDAALDAAWVALCLARTLVGDNLGAAWQELHRSNIIDKQVDGRFRLDATGKVMKPDGWEPPNFGQFLLKE